MNPLQQYFKKSLQALTFQDVAQYFEAARFTSNQIAFYPYNAALPFKKNFKLVCQAVCAMLNSAGGVIIWGAAEGKSIVGSKQKSYSGAVSPITKAKLEANDLINQIAEKTIPYTTHFEVVVLEQEDKQICIFSIPKSSQAPHQFEDRYYAMLENKSRIAPHHYIEALFKQNTFPNLEGYIQFKSLRDNGLHYCLDLEVHIFNFSHLYNETDVSFILTCKQGKFLKLRFGNDPRVYRMGGESTVRSGVLEILHYGMPFSKALMLTVSPKDIINQNFEIEIQLQFGGKKSPLKESNYRLNLSKLNLPNINDIVVEAIENQVAYEKENDIQENKQKLLKSIVNR